MIKIQRCSTVYSIVRASKAFQTSFIVLRLILTIMSCTTGRHLQYPAKKRTKVLPDAMILAVTRVSVTDVKCTGIASVYYSGGMQAAIYVPYRLRSRFGE